MPFIVCLAGRAAQPICDSCRQRRHHPSSICLLVLGGVGSCGNARIAQLEKGRAAAGVPGVKGCSKPRGTRHPPACAICRGALPSVTDVCSSLGIFCCTTLTPCLCNKCLLHPRANAEARSAFTFLLCAQQAQWRSCLQPATVCACAASTSGRGFAALPAQEAADAGVPQPCAGPAQSAHLVQACAPSIAS